MSKLILPHHSTDIKRLMEEAYLGLGDTTKLKINDYILTRKEEFEDNPYLDILDLLRQPENFYLTCKYLFNIDIHPFQLVVLQELWNRKFPMFIASRGSSKTFSLALYCLLRALFHQPCKIILTGSGFRQAKLLFDYMEVIWNKSPILRNIVGEDQRQGPRRDIDRCTFFIGQSEVIAIPTGSGEKIRGLRANYIIVDEFSSINREIFETVIRGFAAVSATPVDNVKKAAGIQILKSLGMYTAEMEEDDYTLGNQIVIAGTAYYSFNHFYTYWKKYKDIIESGGNRDKLEEIFQGEVPEDFNWRDYSIIRLPYDYLPKGFMDDVQVAQAKALSHSAIYLMEYGACVCPGTKIITSRGLINIENINVGDKVLTHKGRFRKVLGRTYRYVNEDIIKLKSYGYNQDIYMTNNHPCLNEDNNWTNAEDLDTKIYWSNLQELNNKQYLDLVDYCTSYNVKQIDNKDYLYAKSSSSKFSEDDIYDIIHSNLSYKQLMEKYSISFSHINHLRNNKKQNNKFKYCIPRLINLNYDFGLIVGYYASEGSCGANGRACSFSLDGHKETSLQQYIQQLQTAIYNVFNINSKIYHKKTNVDDVTINNRLIVELLKTICPGVSHTKIINHDILFSNKEFLKGFITGYWNGDGHWRRNRNFAVAGCVNENLLIQLKLALSYFGISTSFIKSKKNKNTIFRNKIYNCRQVYKLSIFGHSLRRFKKIFYNHDDNEPERIKAKKCYIDKKQTISKIISKENVHYDGFVYNLHIEEDESYSLINTTVHNCYVTDSDGFFKRSVIEKCVCNEPIMTPMGTNVKFEANTRGSPNCKYVMGIDPASESDNFAINILEVYPDHRRIVYSWTVTRQKMRERLKKSGKESEDSFYNYCARKIRTLLKVFPCDHIGIDAQGGGIGIIEALHDPALLEPGELPIYPYIKEGDSDVYWWEEKNKPTDGLPGLHILHVVQFANVRFIAEANHGLRQDLETRILLFPYFDSASIGLAIENDKIEHREYDTLEDVVFEIEELKDELATIVHSQTTTGRDHWDTPETKLGINKRKGRMRKDRYSALLISNMLARIGSLVVSRPEYKSIGGYVSKSKPKKEIQGQLYTGPQHIVGKISYMGGIGIKR